MSGQTLLSRITSNPDVMVGKPVIHDTSLTVDYILNLLGHGESIEAILGEYPGLEESDIRACLLFAARSIKNTSFMPVLEMT